jgi:hypothetical protein
LGITPHEAEVTSNLSFPLWPKLIPQASPVPSQKTKKGNICQENKGIFSKNKLINICVGICTKMKGIREKCLDVEYLF